MNRIYSKVWNKSLGMLVVASELAKQSHGTVGASRASPVSAATFLALSIGGALWAMPATAGNICLQLDGGTWPTASGNNSYACGREAVASGQLATAIGHQSKATATGATASVTG